VVSREVVCEIGGRRASLTLNRPEKLNVLNVALVARLEEQARRVSAEDCTKSQPKVSTA
jgi:enoyl-CoA hydratase/carnithine racemase